MVKFTGYRPEEVVNIVRKAIAKSASAEFTRGLKQRLTYWYLGVQSGTLRNQTNAVSDNMTVYAGTIPWYGHAYETGDWDRWKGRIGNKKEYKRSRKASWAGLKSHRPFLSDTIKSKTTMKGIAIRAKAELNKSFKEKK